MTNNAPVRRGLLTPYTLTLLHLLSLFGSTGSLVSQNKFQDNFHHLRIFLLLPAFVTHSRILPSKVGGEQAWPQSWRPAGRFAIRSLNTQYTQTVWTNDNTLSSHKKLLNWILSLQKTNSLSLLWSHLPCLLDMSTNHFYSVSPATYTLHPTNHLQQQTLDIPDRLLSSISVPDAATQAGHNDPATAPKDSCELDR